MSNEQSQYPTFHMCAFCALTFSDYYKEAEWCRNCAEEIVKVKQKPAHQVICKQCEKPFQTKYDRKIFCSRLCATAWHNYVNKYMMDEYKRMTSKEDTNGKM
jgi:predicted amidophosphoribosyltransferase